MPRNNFKPTAAFTLIELLIVILIIAVLMGLAFPAFQGVQNTAKKTQAKNDLTQIVTAINAFYTEYGKYPCGAQQGGDGNDYLAADDATQSKLFTDLRGISGLSDPTINPRMIAFIQIPAKGLAHDQTKGGICKDGHFHDPWGSPYRVKLDNNYNSLLQNPYKVDSGAGFGVLNLGVIAWSFGKNGALGGGPAASPKFSNEGGTPSNFAGSGDIISWQ